MASIKIINLKTMEHACIQEGAIKKIEQALNDHITKQDESDAERMRYRNERKIHDDAIAKFMSSADEVMKIVNTKLLPAYRKEQKAEIAKEWIKEQAKSGKFWIGILLSIAAFFGLLTVIIKQSLK